MSDYLGEFEQLILFAVLRLGDKAYGVSIRQAIESRTGQNVSAGAVYTALGRLEARGFVRSRLGKATAQRAGRRRKYYRLETVGANALHRSYAVVRQMAEGVVPKLEGIISSE